MNADLDKLYRSMSLDERKLLVGQYRRGEAAFDATGTAYPSYLEHAFKELTRRGLISPVPAKNRGWVQATITDDGRRLAQYVIEQGDLPLDDGGMERVCDQLSDAAKVNLQHAVKKADLDIGRVHTGLGKWTTIGADSVLKALRNRYLLDPDSGVLTARGAQVGRHLNEETIRSRRSGNAMVFGP